MNSKIKEVKTLFEENNFEEVLSVIENEEFCGREESVVAVYKYYSLMKLKRYSESVEIINSLIEKTPYNLYLWGDKFRCHYFNNDMTSAAKALDEMERMVDDTNIEDLIFISDCFNHFNDEKALKYINMAMELDGNNVRVLQQKALVASGLKDWKLMKECADEFLNLSDGEEVQYFMMPFMLYLFSRHYRECFDLACNHFPSGGEHRELLMMVLFKTLGEDLEICVGLEHPLEISCEDAVKLILKYHYGNVGSGEINGVKYKIYNNQ